MNFSSIRNSSAQRDVRKLKNELESTSDSLDETQKRLKSVKLERDSLQDDFEGAGKKIDQLKRKIELQEDDLMKLENEKENLLEDKTEMRENGRDGRRKKNASRNYSQGE